MIGTHELLLILLVVIVVFGAGRFPSIMENFAKGIKSFKKTMKEDEKKPSGAARKGTKRKPRRKG
jgi:sec-independent protein translocase protein TatA